MYMNNPIVLFEKDGLKFCKVREKVYTLSLTLENNNIFLAQVMNFDLIKLIYDLNPDIYEYVDLKKNNEENAQVLVILKHFFEDLGMPQKYSHMNIHKIVNEEEIIFKSETIHGSRPSNIPDYCDKMAMKEMTSVCKIITQHKIQCDFYVHFDNSMVIPPFAEKMIGMILHKVFKRVKHFIENIRF
jgi:hypothetical protein